MQVTHFAHCQYQSMSKKCKTLHEDDQNTSAPCPRCKSGLFTPGKSIQIHLARHCTVRLLWNNPTNRNSKSSTQSQDQMLSGSIQTLNQQAKQFNVIPTQVNVTLQNTLSSMPSLLHLATLQTDGINTNVNYPNIELENSGANDDFFEGSPDTMVVDQISQAQGTVVVESCPFKRGTIKFLPDIAFQVHLLSQFQAHQGNDLNTFNQIMECVKNHDALPCINFATLEIMSR